MFGAFGEDDEQGGDRANSRAESFYGSSNIDDWSSYPGSGGGDSALSPPPLVAAAQPEGSATSTADWFRMGKDVVGTFVNIFGQPVQQRPPPAAPVAQPGIPLWGWALLGIGAVAVAGFAIRSLKSNGGGARRRRYAGRRSRR